MTMNTKRMIHLTLAATTSSSLAILAAEACGGHLVVGYDDAGNYHTGDGSILKYGSACVGWDASGWFVDGGVPCDINDPDSGAYPSAAFCTAVLAPPGYYAAFSCRHVPLLDDAGNAVVDDGGHPVLNDDAGVCENPAPSAQVPSCDIHDPNANPFCTAYFEQFILNGHVRGVCGNGVCEFIDDVGVCGNWIARTVADGSVVCGPPCTP
jgi:hypothetical protein